MSSVTNNVTYLERPGSGDTYVLLHGIGSNASNWQHILDLGLGEARIIAWNAPGYLDSKPLSMHEPSPHDYAQVLAAFLQELQIANPILVGHSLGALMAAAYAKDHAVKHLCLLSPAQGYAQAEPSIRVQKRDERLQMLDSLGIEEMAKTRSKALLRPDASEAELATAQAAMLQLNVAGYRQATHCLSHGHLLADAQKCKAPITVGCGELDVITPAKGARRLAHDLQAPYADLGAVGHMVAIEAPEAVRDLLLSLR